jgi:hypothetical protein
MKTDSRNSDVNCGYNPLPNDDGEWLSVGTQDFKGTFDMCREMQAIAIGLDLP